MKTIWSLAVLLLLLLGCDNQPLSKDTDSVIFNPDSPAAVPQLFVPASTSGSQKLRTAWRDYLLETNAYRAKFTYDEDAYMVDQFDPKHTRRYMAGVQIFSVASGTGGPVLTRVGEEFNGFYINNRNGFWAAFDPIDKPEDAIKAMLKRVQNSGPGSPSERGVGGPVE